MRFGGRDLRGCIPCDRALILRAMPGDGESGLLRRAMAAMPDGRQLLVWLTALAIGSLGGAAFRWIGTPLPWLLGGMVATAAAMGLGVRVAGRELSFPQGPRLAFITIIGLAIGGSAEPGMWGQVGEWWRSLLSVGVFVAVAQALNYQLFRRAAGYDRPTAFYCANPGGLIESLQLGEEAGGNVALLTVQHFSRIALTVSTVPLIYWAMRGEAVGSAAGVVLGDEAAPVGLWDVALLAACAVLGGWGGRRVGLPAAIITGPVILSTLVHGAGWTQAVPPGWLISIAQLVIGVGLALRFQGMTGRLLAQGIGFGALSVGIMLSTGAALAWALSLTGEHPFQVLLMCYAPGGVVEMGLIALSLGVSPIMVTLHHIVRILFTVIAVPMVGRRWVLAGRAGREPAE
jgi:membrane AbrB-like protein